MKSIKRVMRAALVELIESKTATTGERLKACRMLLKLSLAPKGKPRGRPFSKKVDMEDPKTRLDRLLSGARKPN